MKESQPDEIMLCFVQGFGDGDYKPSELNNPGGSNLSRRRRQKKLTIQRPEVNEVEIFDENASVIGEPVQIRSRKSQSIVGRSLRLSSGDRYVNRLPGVKRSFSDRFSDVVDVNGKRATKGLLTIRKTWSTGNFAAGAAGGGCGAPRSAPATPLQLEPHPRNSKHEKHAVKPLSGSAPSVREGPGVGVGGAPNVNGGPDSADGKQPSKSRQKKFQRHFPQVGPEERVLNYYSCALVGDLLLQGHLYITKNYFAFYSNVFGYVTKLLIPITSVLRITKEKVARIIPNAVGVCTRDERHVFGSLLSRDSTYKLMNHVWKASRVPELATPQPQDLRASEVELDASEYSPDDSSSGGADRRDSPAPCLPIKRDSEAIISTAGAAVIQPALLLGAPAPPQRMSSPFGLRALRPQPVHALLALILLLCISALLLAHRLHRTRVQEDVLQLSGEELYSALVRWRARLHGRAASEMHAFLNTNLILLTKVRQSLEALSGVILTDMAHSGHSNLDVPNETAFR